MDGPPIGTQSKLDWIGILFARPGCHNWIGIQIGTVPNWNRIGIWLDGPPKFWPVPIGIVGILEYWNPIWNLESGFQFGLRNPISRRIEPLLKLATHTHDEIAASLPTLSGFLSLLIGSLILPSAVTLNLDLN